MAIVAERKGEAIFVLVEVEGRVAELLSVSWREDAEADGELVVVATRSVDRALVGGWRLQLLLLRLLLNLRLSHETRLEGWRVGGGAGGCLRGHLLAGELAHTRGLELGLRLLLLLEEAHLRLAGKSRVRGQLVGAPIEQS